MDFANDLKSLLNPIDNLESLANIVIFLMDRLTGLMVHLTFKYVFLWTSRTISWSAKSIFLTVLG